MRNIPDSIRRRWRNANDFYSERDHRTQLEVTNLHAYVNKPIEIHVDQELADDVTIQRIAILAANLTARWARNVRVFAPNVELAAPLRVHNDRRLSARIEREMMEADPFASFEVGDISASDSASLRLYVGPCKHFARSLTGLDYFVDASGWSALGHRGTSDAICSRTVATAPAAALAAAIGAGDLFKRAIGHPIEHWLGQVSWSTWNHKLNSKWDSSDQGPCVPNSADVGDLLVAGIGAIGSALLYILSLAPLKGRLVVLDRDFVETSNLNRSPLFTVLDAAVSRKKTEVAQALLRSLSIEAEAVEGSWRENAERLGRNRLDAWVSLTNEDGAWAEVPFQLPPIVLHGTTTSGWGIAFGRHIPRMEDCTACRLPRPHAEFRGPCAEGEVSPPNQGEPVRASLPFLSTASAALIGAELLKLDLPGVSSLPNAAYADFRVGVPTVVSVLRRPTIGCGGCQMANLPIWAERGGRSLYAPLSLGQVSG